MLLSVVFVAILIHETKGKTLDEIRCLFGSAPALDEVLMKWRLTTLICPLISKICFYKDCLVCSSMYKPSSLSRHPMNYIFIFSTSQRYFDIQGPSLLLLNGTIQILCFSKNKWIICSVFHWTSNSLKWLLLPSFISPLLHQNLTVSFFQTFRKSKMLGYNWRLLPSSRSPLLQQNLTEYLLQLLNKSKIFQYKIAHLLVLSRTLLRCFKLKTTFFSKWNSYQGFQSFLRSCS